MLLLLAAVPVTTIELPSIDGTSPVTGLAYIGPPPNGGVTTIELPSIDGSSDPVGPIQIYAVDSDGYRPW